MSWNIQGGGRVSAYEVYFRQWRRSDASGTALGSSVSLGTISYGVYLWHEPLILFAVTHDLIAGTAWTFLPTALAMLGVTSLVAAAQWRWVEAPSLREP